MRAREAAHDDDEQAIKEVVLAGRPAMVDVGTPSISETDEAKASRRSGDHLRDYSCAAIRLSVAGLPIGVRSMHDSLQPVSSMSKARPVGSTIPRPDLHGWHALGEQH